jgi:PAS domain S-box-containing protein
MTKKTTEEDPHRLIEELNIHKLELEVQNEELRKIQSDLRAAHDQYAVLYKRAPVAYLTLSTKGEILNCNLAAGKLFNMTSPQMVGRSLHDFVSEDSQDALHLHRHALIRDSQSPATLLSLKTESDEPKTVLLESELDEQLNPGTLSWFASLTDISDQKRLEAELSNLNQELEERVRERARQYLVSRNETLAILNAVADPIVTIDSKSCIQSVNKAACRVFGYLDDEVIGSDISALLTNSGNTILNSALEDCASENAGQTPEARRELLCRTRSGEPIPVDMVLARVDESDQFTIVFRDLREKKRLEWEVMQVAEDERSRISRDLHDSLGQELAAMSLDTRMIADDLAKEDKKASSQLEGFSEKLQQCIAQLRTIILSLAPIDVSDGGIIDALEALVRSIPDQNGTQCSFHVSRPKAIRNLPRKTEIQLLRIAQEAVHNARKHSRARQIAVDLSGKDGDVELQIIDDGEGLPASGRTSLSGQGVRIMEYRCGLVGGDFSISNFEPKGTRVVCRIGAGSRSLETE